VTRSAVIPKMISHRPRADIVVGDGEGEGEGEGCTLEALGALIGDTAKR
jgi:hypothetical protein